jgi:hypothetical protein
VQVDIGELQAGIVEDHHGAGPQAHVESAVDPAGDTPYYAVAAVGYTDGGAVCWLPQAPALPPSAVKFEMEMLPSMYGSDEGANTIRRLWCFLW